MNPGDVLDGRYRIVSLVGEGTFAYVYRARHLVIDSLEVAIKVLKPDFVADEELQKQFVHEAETVAMLRNTHTVRVTDMGRMPDGRPYICMEYCDGVTLNQLVRLYGPISTATAAHIADGVLQSLREAHDLGIIHRDIKPSNVILAGSTVGGLPLVRILDFGIAHAIQRHDIAQDDAASNFVFCTPSYAAPEVLHGKPSKSADLYALGLTLAELIEGTPVYPNDGFYKVAARQTSNEPTPFGPQTRANALFPIIERACQKNAELRYASVDEMLHDLRKVSKTLDYSNLRHDHYPPPIGCGMPEQCALRHDLSALARASSCPHPNCNLRLNPSPQRDLPLSKAQEADEYGTLRAALAMEADDLAFDLDAFTDTEVHPRIALSSDASQDDELWDNAPTAPLVRARMDHDAAAYDTDGGYGPTLARANTDDFIGGMEPSSQTSTNRFRADAIVGASPHEAITTGRAPAHTPVSQASVVNAPMGGQTDAGLAARASTALNSGSFLTLQRTLFPVSAQANTPRRVLWSVLCGVLIFALLVGLLFQGPTSILR